jgi:hypothetical protein
MTTSSAAKLKKAFLLEVTRNYCLYCLPNHSNTSFTHPMPKCWTSVRRWPDASAPFSGSAEDMQSRLNPDAVHVIAG